MNRLRIIRARRDSPRIVATLAGTLVSLIVGYQAGATIFRPSAAATEVNPDTDPSNGNTPAPPQPASVVDAGRARAQAPAAAPTVSAHINGGLLSGCGDGEEISIASASCDTPAGAEAALRAHLAMVANCPSAPSAARDPTRVLSTGLTVDFERHRVAVLIGRSSSVPDKVSYMACIREGLSGLEDLWALPHAHRRYLWFFNVHFSPLSGAVVPPEPEPTPEPTPIAAPTPEPSPTQVVTPTPPAPTETDAGVAHAIPIPLDELVRHSATGRSTVTWSTAIVRSSPRDGEVVGRLPQGTEIELLERRGGWWAIRWDSHSPHAGWAWHLAIGQ